MRATPGSRRTRGARLVAVALALQLAAQLAAVVLLPRAQPAPAPSATGAAAVRGAPSAVAAAREARTRAVRALLDARAAAVRGRDRNAFLATVWPGAPEFARKQGELFDALQGVPLGDWQYALDAGTERPATTALDGKYGAGRYWAPGVTLRYAITGFDTTPATAPQQLTFVQDGERWLLAADDDFDGTDRKTVRGLWDFGPVVRCRGARTLALGHPGSERLLAQLCTAVDAAVPRVSGVWGTDWPQAVVVLVPDDQAELDRLLGGTTVLTGIAAVATAELSDVDDGYHPVGDRVAVNPPNFARLGPLGRQVVLTHETTHVATRTATGPLMPTWLVEGIADYVGYLGVPVPAATAARDLQAAVRAGRVPEALPTDPQFGGGNPDLAAVYEQSWLAFRLLVETYGRDAALRFYRAVGASRGTGSSQAVDAAFSSVLGTTTQAFTQAWRAYLLRTLR